MDSVVTIVIEKISELLELVDPSSIGAATRLQDLGIDSGLMLELFLLIEDRLPGLEINPEELRPEHFASVQSLAAFASSNCAVVEGGDERRSL